MFQDFTKMNYMNTINLNIPYNFPVSKEEDKLWKSVRACDKCRNIPSIRDAESNGIKVNGYCLNVENQLTSNNQICRGKFIGEGPSESIMFIGMNPGKKRVKGDRTLRGVLPTAGGKLGQMFKSVGKTPDDYYLTNLVKCSTIDDKLSKDIIFNCEEWLLLEIKVKRPKAIVLLGTDVIESFSDLTNKKFFRNNECEIVDFPGIKLFNVRIYATFHPSAHFDAFPNEERKKIMEIIESQNTCPQTLDSTQVPSIKKQSENKYVTNKQNSRIEFETLETIKSGIITFQKYSASDIFVRLVSLYGFDKNKIISGMEEAKKRNKFKAEPNKKWLKMHPLVKKLLDKGHRLPEVNSLEDAIEY
jgi:uracil-DNA glycosylase family 4